MQRRIHYAAALEHEKIPCYWMRRANAFQIGPVTPGSLRLAQTYLRELRGPAFKFRRLAFARETQIGPDEGRNCLPLAFERLDPEVQKYESG